MNNTNINSKRKLLGNALWAFSGQALGTISGIISSAILARLLNASELGAYFIALSFITIISAFIQLGLGRTAVLVVAQSLALDNVHDSWLAVKKIFTIVTISSVTSSIILYYFLIDYITLDVINTPDLSLLKIPLIIWVIAFTFRNITAEIYRGFHNIKAAVLLGDPLTRLLFVILLVIAWMLTTHIQLIHAIILMIMSVSISAIIGCGNLYKKSIASSPSDKIKTNILLKISIPFLITSLANLTYTQADIWIIGGAGTQDDVAVYGAVMRLVLLVSGPLLILNSILPSIITDLHTKGKFLDLQYILRTAASFAAIPSVILLLMFVLFGDIILAAVYGDYYAKGHHILAIISIGHIVSVSTGSAGLTLMMAGKHKVMMVITIISALSLVAFGSIAAKHYGVIGMATINAAVISGNCLVSWILVKKTIGIWSHASPAYIDTKDINSIYKLLSKKLKRGL